MKILICSNVFGNFQELKKDADFLGPDLFYILIAGNVGINRETPFFSEDNSGIYFKQLIFYVTGKHEDFSFAKEIEHTWGDFPPRTDFVCPYIVSPLGDIVGLPPNEFSLCGVSGTYSPLFYEKESAPPRHMTRKQLFSIPKNADIVLLHKIPGQLAKSGSLDFHDDVFNLIKEKSPRYIFIGGYDRLSHFRFLDTTVVFITSLNKGYAIIDTGEWSCFFQHKMI